MIKIRKKVETPIRRTIVKKARGPKKPARISRAEFYALPKVDGVVPCPGRTDYRNIRKVAPYRVFGKWCTFGDGTTFGPRCSFGDHCTFGAGCTFGEKTRFGKGTTLEGDKLLFGSSVYLASGMIERDVVTMAIPTSDTIWVRHAEFLGTIDEAWAELGAPLQDKLHRWNVQLLLNMFEARWVAHLNKVGLLTRTEWNSSIRFGKRVWRLTPWIF